MNNFSVFITILMILCYAKQCACSSEKNLNQEDIKTQDQKLQNVLLSPATSAPENCETMIIIDLSKNVVTKEVFDVSIKVFLKFILEYCNNFKYVIIDDKFNECESSNGCNITVNICDAKNGCETIINNLDYNIITSNYSTELYVENLKNYTKFLNQTFADIYPCQDDSVFLITNRIVNLNPDSGFIATIKNSNIKLTVILLDRNETSANTYLEVVYETIPNARTLIFVNYDCLSYLFYCLLPCSNDAQQCLQTDITDCQYRSKWTPNATPRETLHAWYVMDFTSYESRDGLLTIFRVLHDALEQFTQAKNISKIRVKAVLDDYTITESYENFESTLHYDTVSLISNGSVIYDYNHLNNRLNLIPWSGTLTETRFGILAIIILTNYATATLLTVKNDQRLLGQMFVYDQGAFNYYNSNKLKNDTNFHFYYLDIKETIVFHPIQNVSSTFTQTSPAGVTVNVTDDVTNTYVASSTIQYDKQRKHSNNTFIIFIICGPIVCGIFLIIFILYFLNRKRNQRKARHEPEITEHIRASTHVKDEWELVWDKLDIQAEIGSGAYGQIFQGILRSDEDNQSNETREEVAIKMPGKLATENEKKQFLNEIYLMKKISGHENIIKMHGCILTGNHICLVIEFCEHSDLLRYVKKIKNDLKTENENDIKKEFAQFLWQMSHGLQYIAERGIVHRDLAARNILIDSNKNAKITDFGLSIQLRDKTYIIPSRSNEKLPIKWLAMESFKSYKFSLKTDIWTFGIVVYEMYSFGETPYEDIEASKFFKYLEKGHRLQKPDFCPNEIFEIIFKCWMENPFRRPTIGEIIQSFQHVLESLFNEYENLDLSSTGNN